MTTKVAGIDVHKKVLMVVVHGSGAAEKEWEPGRFGTTTQQLRRLAAWLRDRGVQEAVMESTAQYWKPVWYELEPYLDRHLAQAYSNKARRGRKRDFEDARRLVRRFLADELILSLVPAPEQRLWRTLTRMKVQLTEDRSRLHNQVECLLEEMRIKLSSVVSDLFGISGCRILRALPAGQTDPGKLAALADGRLPCTAEQLREALNGQPQPIHLQLLALYLDRYQVLNEQAAKLNQMTAEALKAHEDAVVRLAEVPGFPPQRRRPVAGDPGFGADSAQQVIAQVGPQAGTFPSAAHLASWVGVCPGQKESAEQNYSSHAAKGNRFLRRILNQAAQAAVRKKGSHFQLLFQPLLPRLSYQGAIWAVAHRLCRLVWKVLHEGVRYIEQGREPNPITQKPRTLRLVRKLRNLGYEVMLQPRLLDQRA
jgi:transposase